MCESVSISEEERLGAMRAATKAAPTGDPARPSPASRRCPRPRPRSGEGTNQEQVSPLSPFPLVASRPVPPSPFVRGLH